MRNLLAVGILCLILGLLACGGGQSDASGADPTQTTVETPAAVRTQVESRCLNTESDFCTRAYAMIAQWIAGQITDEEFVDGVVELRQVSLPDDVESDEEIENDPTLPPCLLPDQQFDYDPSWEGQVNARERAVYRGTGATTTVPAKETIRIYSYDPDGQSYENTFEVLIKLFCELTQDPVFHGVTLQKFQYVNDGRTRTYYGYLGRADGNIVLFFKEADVPALLELYAEMAYPQIREHLILNQGYDYIGHTIFEDIGLVLENVSDWHSTPKRASFSYSFDSCVEQSPGLCLPFSGEGRWSDWVRFYNDNREEILRRAYERRETDASLLTEVTSLPEQKQE